MMKRQIYRTKLLLCLCVISLLLSAPMGFAATGLHAKFDQILRVSVEDGEVNYPKIKADAGFTEYLKSIESTQTFANESEELAFWINSYNALAIKGILDKRSPKSLLGRHGYFKKAKYNVGGKRINLFDLERKVIIPIGEPRIHFAINCASGSCPKLLPEVYLAETLEQQLETAAKEFINDMSRNTFDRENKIARLSKIFDWFKDDFSNYSGSVQKYIAQYIDDPTLAEALRNESYKIKYLKYDWSLNGIKP